VNSIVDKIKADDSATAIRIDGVCKAFGHRAVLNNISFNLPAAEAVFLCGVNGAGKSTLLRIVAGILSPDSGSVQICGHDIHKSHDTAKSRLGIISHKSMVYPELTVLENLSFFAALYGVPDRQGRINEILEDMGLSAYRYDSAGILSRGLLQRLSIARALVHKPAILLADEPFTGLDTQACQYLVAVFERFTNAGGTIIMTSHDIGLALRNCKRVMVLDKGKIIFDVARAALDIASFTQDYLLYARNKQ
jgi:heme exporter protein A